MKPFSALQKRFAKEYARDDNGTQAAIRAGYSENGACQQASNLLQDERIQELIAKLRENQVSVDDMTIDGHLRAVSALRAKLEDAGEDAEITAPQVSALRGAVDAEVARGRALGFYIRSSRTPEGLPERPNSVKTMSELLHDTSSNGGGKEAESQTNGTGEHDEPPIPRGRRTPP